MAENKCSKKIQIVLGITAFIILALVITIVVLIVTDNDDSSLMSKGSRKAKKGKKNVLNKRPKSASNSQNRVANSQNRNANLQNEQPVRAQTSEMQNVSATPLDANDEIAAGVLMKTSRAFDDARSMFPNASEGAEAFGNPVWTPEKMKEARDKTAVVQRANERSRMQNGRTSLMKQARAYNDAYGRGLGPIQDMHVQNLHRQSQGLSLDGGISGIGGTTSLPAGLDSTAPLSSRQDGVTNDYISSDDDDLSSRR